MIIKVLGTGCAKCVNLEKKVKELVAANSIDAEVVKIDQLQDIMAFGIMSTPGLVVNEKVKHFGSIPKDEQILNWIREEM